VQSKAFKSGPRVMQQICCGYKLEIDTGGIKEVGTYALHIDCPWSWTCNEALFANQETEAQQLNELISLPVTCQRIVAQDNGSFEIQFDNQTKFSVFVEADLDPLAEEFWRHSKAKHFVVGSRGLLNDYG